ncbi:amidohydrolase [Haloechinothrix sp. YIM 98757]|uniref:Amidohydrolase n=1 Tax=Haloechinothrix aidingensis TaxID=2752311 RepID=A0A838ABG4_9PSEU|nr:amidohydrolase [Haloechinothrix aidingensis]MBA0126577.1 amidohydrolase [Haloechinothrix aidingensis]
MRTMRRICVAIGAVALALTTATGATGAAADSESGAGADTVLLHGFVYTADARGSVAEAVAVEDGVIVYVGNDRGAEGFIGAGTEVIDLDGRMVMPGIHDAHIHGISEGHPRCDLDYQPLTVAEFEARIEECANNPEFGTGADDWLPVDNWYIQFLRPRGAEVDKDTLDALDTDRPVIVYSVFAHSALANSRALELAGITSETEDPPDGVIGRDGDGEPDGWLYDGAQQLVDEVIPPPPPVDPVVAAGRGMETFAEEGITSFFVPGASGETVENFVRLREDGGLTSRAHFAIRGQAATGEDLDRFVDELDRMRAELENLDQLPQQVHRWRSDHVAGPRVVAEPGVSIDGVKYFMDGISQHPAQTAALLEPYRENVGTDDEPEWVPGDNDGELYIDPDALAEMVTTLDQAGYQTKVHAIGSRAVRSSLDSFAAMRDDSTQGRGHEDGAGSGHGYGQGRARGAGHGTDSRPSVEHAEIVHPDDFGRFEQLGVLPVMSYQWAKPAPDSTDAVKPYLGPERWDWYQPEGQLHEAGARIAFGSDYPVDPLDQFFALEVAVLRAADWGPEYPEYAGTLNEDPGLSLAEAIRGMTIDAAYAMHQDEVTGSLERGKLADLLVLDQNLFDVPRDDISETTVLHTMVGGEVVHSRLQPEREEDRS